MSARSEYHKVLADTLKTIRGRTPYSQMDVAERAGCSTKALARYETGDRAPSTRDRMQKLCVAIQASPDETAAILDIWSMIQTRNYTTVSTAPRRKTGARGMAFPPPLDPEVRALQARITNLRASSHADWPVIACAALNAVQRIAEQVEQWEQSVGVRT